MLLLCDLVSLMYSISTQPPSPSFLGLPLLPLRTLCTLCTTTTTTTTTSALRLPVLINLNKPIPLHGALVAGPPPIRRLPAPVVAPRALPLARLLVERPVLQRALLPRLGLDPLARRELLPLGGLLGRRQWLLARQGRRRRGQGQEDPVRGRGQGGCR